MRYLFFRWLRRYSGFVPSPVAFFIMSCESRELPIRPYVFHQPVTYKLNIAVAEHLLPSQDSSF